MKIADFIFKYLLLVLFKDARLIMLQKENSLKPTRPLRDYLIPVILIIVIAAGGYNLFMTPPKMPDPLMITIDGEEYPDSQFGETYDYTGFAHKRKELFYPVNWDEFSSSNGETLTEYSSDSISDAWEKIDHLEAPEYSKGLAQWLCNGTLDEVGLRYYGDLRTFRDWASAKHVSSGISCDTKLCCEFDVYRGSGFYYDDILEESDIGVPQGEIVMLEKWYNKKSESGSGPVWAYCVFIETDSPVRSVLIQLKR